MDLPVFPYPLNAHFPSPAEEWAERRVDLNDLLLLHPITSFYARVTGNSMSNAGIQDGDIVIVDRALDPWDNCIVVARLNHEFTIKRLRMIDGSMRLQSEHPDAHPPILITSQTDFHLWGVVVCVIHPFTVRRPV